MDIEEVVRTKKDTEAIAHAQKLVTDSLKDGKFLDIFDELMEIEKKFRLMPDMDTAPEIVVIIIQGLFDAGLFDKLNEVIVMLSKKRAQLKQATQRMIQLSYQLVQKVAVEEVKVALIKAIRKVTEGKIYGEAEHVRLTKQLAEIYEKNGKINEAGDLLNEVTTETVSSIDKKEIAAFFLDQIRFCLLRKDYVRGRITGNKVNRTVLKGKGFEELKVRFYNLMIDIYMESGEYLLACQSYLCIYDTEYEASFEKDRKVAAVSSALVCIAISAQAPERVDTLLRISSLPVVQDLAPAEKDLLEALNSKEIVRFGELEAKHKTSLMAGNVIAGRDDLWSVMHTRFNDQNVRNIALYYDRIGIDRLAQLLDLTPEGAEQAIASNVTCDFGIYAKIDSPGKFVTFVQRKTPDQVLDSWANGVAEALKIVDRTNHLIDIERTMQ